MLFKELTHCIKCLKEIQWKSVICRLTVVFDSYTIIYQFLLEKRNSLCQHHTGCNKEQIIRSENFLEFDSIPFYQIMTDKFVPCPVLKGIKNMLRHIFVRKNLLAGSIFFPERSLVKICLMRCIIITHNLLYADFCPCFLTPSVTLLEKS